MLGLITATLSTVVPAPTPSYFSPPAHWRLHSEWEMMVGAPRLGSDSLSSGYYYLISHWEETHYFWLYLSVDLYNSLRNVIGLSPCSLFFFTFFFFFPGLTCVTLNANKIHDWGGRSSSKWMAAYVRPALRWASHSPLMCYKQSTIILIYYGLHCSFFLTWWMASGMWDCIDKGWLMTSSHLLWSPRSPNRSNSFSIQHRGRWRLHKHFSAFIVMFSSSYTSWKHW